MLRLGRKSCTNIGLRTNVVESAVVEEVEEVVEVDGEGEDEQGKSDGRRGGWVVSIFLSA